MKLQYLLLIAAALLVLITSPIWIAQYDDQKRCDYIESLAKNPDVINTLDLWISDNILDKGYYFVSGSLGSISAHKNIESESYDISLPDNKLTGIADELFRLSISKHDSSHADPIVSTNVHSIDIGRGRDQIIIAKNGHDLHSYRGHDLASGKLKKIII